MVGVLGLMFLTGCVPDLVSVSRDGTIALSLQPDAEFEPFEGDGECVYLTNANAEFLIKVEDMKGCMYPQISPSGRCIVALSEDGLVLYDREAKKARVIYRRPEDDDDWSPFFPVWSPDEKRLAFFVGDFGEEVPDCALIVYDVESREREVIARRTSPRASWMPDSRGLLYISVPPGVSEGSGEPPFGHLEMIDVRTGEKRTLARRQLFSYSRTAVFPGGNAILYPCVRWDKLQITRWGVAVPLVLKKELIPGPQDGSFMRQQKAEERRPDKATFFSKGEEEAKPPQPEQAEGKRDVEKARPAAGEEWPEEKDFILEEGQPFHPHVCEVSPDGKKIAYARRVWTATGSDKIGLPGEVELKKPRPNEEESEDARGADDEDTEAEGWEVCVAKADGTGSVAVAQASEEGFFQVLWVSNTRLICVVDEGILAVDADGKNKLNLIDAIRAKFADQFGGKEEEEQVEEKEAEPGEETK